VQPAIFEAFDGFLSAIIEDARQAGTLDVGLGQRWHPPCWVRKIEVRRDLLVTDVAVHPPKHLTFKLHSPC